MAVDIQNRSLTALLGAHLFAAAGSSLFTIAVVWLLFAETGQSLPVAGALFVFLLPRAMWKILARPFFGSVNSKWILCVAYTSCAIAVALIPFAGSTRTVVVSIVAAAVAGLASAATVPAIKSMIPVVVSAPKQRSTVELFSSIQHLSPLLYVVGGILVVNLGLSDSLFIIAGLFVLAAGVLLAVPSRAGAKTDSLSIVEASTAFKQGLDQIRHHELLLNMMILAVFLGFAMGPLGLLLPFLVNSGLEGSAFQFALLYSLLFVGLVAGTAVARSVPAIINQRIGATISGATVASGLILVVTGYVFRELSVTIEIASILFVLFGVAIAFVQVPISTLVDEALPEADTTRTVNEALVLLAPPVSVLLTSFIVNFADSVVALTFTGTVVIVVGIAVMFTPLGRQQYNHSTVVNR